MKTGTGGVGEGMKETGRCTRQFALIVELNVRFLLSLLRAGQYIAGNASRREGRHARAS